MLLGGRFSFACAVKGIVAHVRGRISALRERRPISPMSLSRWNDDVTWGLSHENTELLSSAYVAARARVIWAASFVEPDKKRRETWYFLEPIRELHGMTADQLVRLGKADEVTALLRAIASGKRGT